VSGPPELRPKHLSVYDLQVEEGTAFGRWYQPGAAPLPSEGEAARCYKVASDVLRNNGK
jgi:coproporphyrinogen III oxidase-like Fe-S oxidoreductase